MRSITVNKFNLKLILVSHLIFAQYFIFARVNSVSFAYTTAYFTLIFNVK